MNEENKVDAPRIASEALQDIVPSAVMRVKSSERKEVLKKLTSLLEISFQKGTRTRDDPKIQQKWFTISGYLAQVLARIVTDLEYEELRSDVDKLKEQVLDKNVIPRRTIKTVSTSRSRSTKKINRKHKASKDSG